MKVLFDNNLPLYIAPTLHGFIQGSGHQATNLRDHTKKIPDVEWMDELAKDADQWIVYTGDFGILKKSSERAVWRASQLRVFFLKGNWLRKPQPHQITARIIWHWPDVLEYASNARGSLAMRLPFGWHSRFEQLAL